MDTVLVRYSEIGTKSQRVQRRMHDRLTSRVEERLSFAGLSADVSQIPGRIVIITDSPDKVAQMVSDLPGVASTSPTIRTDPTIEAVAQATDHLTIGDRFGVRGNVAGHHPFSSSDINQDVGAYIQNQTDASVDLESPTTWIEIDIRDDAGFVFTDRYPGPGGFPIGSQDQLVALISGGIDSPVASYLAMTRGSDIIPVYAYNRPIAAGDHLARFEEVLSQLRSIHPGKSWYYQKVDMKSINEQLLDIDRGRMILHRIILFRVAEHIATQTGSAGIVTGESIGQKSSQTVANLQRTSAAIDVPVHRPLLTMTKEEITEEARSLGTFKTAAVNAACQTLAPEHPATRLSDEDFTRLRNRVDLDGLVATAIDSIERIELAEPEDRTGN